jgi:hypothetical protein
LVSEAGAFSRLDGACMALAPRLGGMKTGAESEEEREEESGEESEEEVDVDVEEEIEDKEREVEVLNVCVFEVGSAVWIDGISNRGEILRPVILRVAG